MHVKDIELYIILYDSYSNSKIQVNYYQLFSRFSRRMTGCSIWFLIRPERKQLQWQSFAFHIAFSSVNFRVLCWNIWNKSIFKCRNFVKNQNKDFFCPQKKKIRWKLFWPEDTNQHHLKTTSTWLWMTFGFLKRENEFPSKVSDIGLWVNYRAGPTLVSIHIICYISYVIINIYRGSIL